MHKLIIVFLFLVTVSYAKEPPNIYFLKQQLISYYDSGEYFKDIKLVTDDAKKCLSAYVEENNREKKLALILDIDDTSLTTVKQNNTFNLGGVSQEKFKNIVMKANTPAILATLDLYNFARSQGVSVFFISGRLEEWRAITVKNLKRVGYKNWEGLYLRPKQKDLTGSYKTNFRNLIRSKGYEIIGNIGDQESDFSDNEVIKCEFKLPNPYYIVK